MLEMNQGAGNFSFCEKDINIDPVLQDSSEISKIKIVDKCEQENVSYNEQSINNFLQNFSY